MAKFEVNVFLKPEVLNPESRAILETIHRQGIPDLKDIKISKKYILEFESKTDASALAQEIASTYLANSVAESFTVSKID